MEAFIKVIWHNVELQINGNKMNAMVVAMVVAHLKSNNHVIIM